MGKFTDYKHAFGEVVTVSKADGTKFYGKVLARRAVYMLSDGQTEIEVPEIDINVPVTLPSENENAHAEAAI